MENIGGIFFFYSTNSVFKLLTYTILYGISIPCLYITYTKELQIYLVITRNPTHMYSLTLPLKLENRDPTFLAWE